jgi:hypothetical protein
VIGLIARCRVPSAIRAVIGLMALGESGLIDLDGFRELDFLKDRSDISAVVIEPVIALLARGLGRARPGGSDVGVAEPFLDLPLLRSCRPWPGVAVNFAASGGRRCSRGDSKWTALIEEVRFARDSALEGDGFEPSVPRLR